MKLKLMIPLSFVLMMLLLTGCGETYTPIGSDSNVSPSPPQQTLAKAQKTLNDIKKDLKQETPPITFKKAWITTNAINNPEARITFQNVSTKPIDAIKISIFCFDNFGNPTSSSGSNEFPAISQELIKSNSIVDKKWTLYLHENTTKYTAVLSNVHFTDGTTWESNNNPIMKIESK